MRLGEFWYVAAETHELRPGKPLARVILDQWVVLFRDTGGRAVALLDRCLHRGSQISRGKVKDGCLQCPYHGWVYDGAGHVTHVPSEGPGPSKIKRRPQLAFDVIERDGFIYVRLEKPTDEAAAVTPFVMPHYGERGWRTIRLQNRFANNVTNCAENFVDVPHTVFVHPKIFRDHHYQEFGAEVVREGGSVVVRYRKETANFGIFSKFLNPGGGEIEHTDSFHMPNVTSVEYRFGPRRVFYITSQSVPVNDAETLVYTDLTWDYGLWTHLAAPVIRWQGQAIIDQDVEILGNQMRTIKRYGAQFMNSEADVIHLLIESIRAELEAGRDPRALPVKRHEIKFWV